MDEMWFTKAIQRSLLLFLALALTLSCDNRPLSLEKHNYEITSAHWNAQTQTLHLSGHAPTSGTQISLHDRATGQKIGSTQVSGNHLWSFSSDDLAKVPCEVQAKTQARSLSKLVENAPADCVQVQVSGRLAGNISVLNDAALTSQHPEGFIVNPVTDTVITQGQSLRFNASALDPNNNSPFSFRWDFGGSALNTTVQNPGMVLFKRPGTFTVTLNVSNSLGIPDPTPAKVQVTVLPANGLLNQPPVASILSPAPQNTINVGDSLYFEASATDPAGTSQLIYLWDFNGIFPRSSNPVPGNLQFNKAGTFVINLQVTDGLGNVNINIAQVSVTVVDNGPENQAPTGLIISPSSDLEILMGGSVFFQAAGFDPDGDTNLSYMWNFGGAAPNSPQQNPGDITFNRVGTFQMRMTVTDSLGLADSNPPTRTITVTDGSNLNNADFPESMILSPDADMTVDVGTTIAFVGEGSSPGGNTPLTYSWDFSGAADPSDLAEPPPVTFDMAGEYLVSLTVTDSLGQVDSTPAERIITVVDAAGAPRGFIDSPAGNMEIFSGDTIDFIGEADSPDPAAVLSYLWTFDGMIPDSTELSPGPVTFDAPGVYEVVFIVSDDQGNVDPTPPSVEITVVDPTAAAPAEPDSIIDSPATDMSIAAGESIMFEGSGVSENPDAVFEYLWTFAGAAPDSMDAVPGPIVFDTPGEYLVTLTVTDTTTDISDPTPAERVITVTDPAAPANPPANLDALPVVAIVSPDADVIIMVGESVEFIGEASDPDGLELTFEWEFGGAAPKSTELSPGSVTFDTPGIFEVEFEATNSAGLEAEASIMVTVEDSEPPAAAPANQGP